MYYRFAVLHFLNLTSFFKEIMSQVLYLPEAVEWIIFTVSVTPEPLPGHPSHGRGQGKPIV